MDLFLSNPALFCRKRSTDGEERAENGTENRVGKSVWEKFPKAVCLFIY